MRADDEAPASYDRVTKHRRRARRVGLGIGAGSVVAIHGALLCVQVEAELFHIWPDPGLILQVGIAGGILLGLGILGWFRARALDDANYMVEKTTPMPFRLVGESDDVWIEGRIRCPKPVRATHFPQRCAWFHHIEEERDGDGDWVKVRERKRHARTWLIRGAVAIRLDLKRATFEHLPELKRKRGSRRHRLTFLRVVGKASASGVALRPRNGECEERPFRPPPGSRAWRKAAGEDVGAANPLDVVPGFARRMKARMMERSREKKQKRAQKVALRPPKNSIAWKRAKQREETGSEAETSPVTDRPDTTWVLTSQGGVQLMVTPLDRARWYDRAEAKEVQWRTSALLALGVASASGVWTLAVTSGGMAVLSAAAAAIALVAGPALLLPILAVSTYNSFVTMHTRVRNAWSHIDADLAARRDLIPNLVETAKGLAKHERGLLEDLARDRSTGEGIGAAVAREADFDERARRLLALAESYPDLKADEAYARLARELTALEEKIAFGRIFYNDTVREHNTLVESFPNVLFAGLLGFRRLPSWSEAAAT